MTPRTIPSTFGEGFYLPNGMFGVPVPGAGIMTDSGLVPFPPGITTLRYMEGCVRDGKRVMAGQPQNGPQLTWVITDGGDWTTDARIPSSPNSIIFDQNTQMFVNTVGSPSYVGSNGYRYVNPSNVVISGDATYSHTAGNLVDEWTDLSPNQDGSLVFGFAAWGLACVVWDGKNYHLLAAGDAERLRAKTDGKTITVIITQKPSGNALMFSGSVADYLALPIYNPPSAPPPQPPFVPSPIGNPYPEDGTLLDMAPFIHCDPSLAGRGGQGQQENIQVETPDGIVLYGKFGQAGSYEMYGTDKVWMTSLEDASGPTESQTWTDSRWFPMQQAIGEAHAFKTGPHFAIYKDRHTGVVLRQVPFDRKMWLHMVWPQFNWGPDLGIRRTAMRVYDPTAQAESATRIIEVRYEAEGAGWVRWEAHRSDLVYPNGPQHGAQFSDASLVQRVDFYRLGGSHVQPQLTGLVPEVVPHLPPLAPPTPTPSVPTSKPMAIVKTGYFKKNGFYLGVDPGDAHKAVYDNRTSGGPWEHAQVTQHDDGNWDGMFIQTNLQVSIQQDGSIQSRPQGTYGGWEQLQIRTEDGSNRTVVYRNDLGGSLLEFEEDQ